MIAAALTSKTVFQPAESLPGSPASQQASAEAIAIAYRMMALSNESTWNSRLYRVERTDEKIQISTPTGELLTQGRVNPAADRLSITLEQANSPVNPPIAQSLEQLRSESVAHLAQALAAHAGTSQLDGSRVYTAGDYSVRQSPDDHLVVNHLKRGRLLETAGSTLLPPDEILVYDDFEQLWEEAQALVQDEWQLPPALTDSQIGSPDLLNDELMAESVSEPDTDQGSASLLPLEGIESELFVQSDVDETHPVPDPEQVEGVPTLLSDVAQSPTPRAIPDELRLDPRPEVEELPEIVPEGQDTLSATKILVDSELYSPQVELEVQTEGLDSTASPSQVSERLVDLEAEATDFRELNDSPQVALPQDQPELLTSPDAKGEIPFDPGVAGVFRAGIHPSASANAFTVVDYDRRIGDFVQNPVVNDTTPAPAQDRVAATSAVPVAAVSADVGLTLQTAQLMVTHLGSQDGDCTTFSGADYRIEQHNGRLSVYAEGRGEILNLAQGMVTHSLLPEDTMRFGQAFKALQADGVGISQSTAPAPAVIHLEPGCLTEDD